MGFVIDGLYDYLTDLLHAFADIFIYPILNILSAIGNLISTIIGIIAAFFGGMYHLMGAVYTYTVDVITIFPESTQALILTGVIVYIVLRIVSIIWTGGE